jgi:hypothetical protein
LGHQQFEVDFLAYSPDYSTVGDINDLTFERIARHRFNFQNRNIGKSKVLKLLARDAGFFIGCTLCRKNYWSESENESKKVGGDFHFGQGLKVCLKL